MIQIDTPGIVISWPGVIVGIIFIGSAITAIIIITILKRNKKLNAMLDIASSDNTNVAGEKKEDDARR